MPFLQKSSKNYYGWRSLFKKKWFEQSILCMDKGTKRISLPPLGVGWGQSRKVWVEMSGRRGLQTLTLIKTEIVHFVRIPSLREETLFHDSDPCRFADRIKLFKKLPSWS